MNREHVTIPVDFVELEGDLQIPDSSRGLVVFVHGSGSSHRSPRNRFVADVLNEAGLGTLLFDLLSESEALDRTNVFDIALLARRLAGAVTWVELQPQASGLPLCLFGASTGAAAAVWAAATELKPAAIVSRGGRPDLAREQLSAVESPVLLIVGGDDRDVLSLNQNAQRQLRCESDLLIIPGANHLFEEPGTLEAAAEAARDWFLNHLQ